MYFTSRTGKRFVIEECRESVVKQLDNLLYSLENIPFSVEGKLLEAWHDLVGDAYE